MRIALVTTPARTRKVNYVLPSGVIALAAYLEQCGHDVKVVDAALLREPHDQIARRVAEFDPQLIGISGIITAYSYVIELSRALRRTLPGVPQVLGGQVSINNTANCFAAAPIDYVVHGYGEIALEKLVRHLGGSMPVEMIPGISFRRGDQIVTNPGREYFKHLDDRPMPAYHLVDMEHYSRPLRREGPDEAVYKGKLLRHPRTIPVFGTLGCTDRCSFCVHEQEFVGIKFASNQNIIDHMKFLNSTYGINIFNMGEEMFISKFSRAKEFNDLMKEHLPDCYWRGTTRADFVTPELIAELKTGNCLAIEWGYESGSQRMLDLMNKRMTVATNHRAYRLAREAGLYNATTIMVGNVGEDNGTVKETIASIRELEMERGSVFIAAAYPGGRTWDWAVERGLIGDTHEYLMRVSDRDAAQFNINLTPYPDWVVKGWRTRVSYAIERIARAKNPDHPLRLTRRWGWRNFFKRLVRDIGLAVLLPLVIDAYFAYYAVAMKLYRSERDRRLSVKVDAKGAILPDRLTVGSPQRFMSEDAVALMMSTTPARTEAVKK